MLIATRRIKSHAKGAVIYFNKGEEVTGLTAHDEAALVRCGALRDTVEERMQAEFDQAKTMMARTTFEDARRVVQARAESIAPPPPVPDASLLPVPDAPLPPVPNATAPAAPDAAPPGAPGAGASAVSASATPAKKRKQA